MNHIDQPWVSMGTPAKKTYDMEIELIQPWSVPVFKTTLPPRILQIMTEISDELVANEETESFSDNLVGQIETELFLDTNILEQAGVMGFFLETLSQFVSLCKHQRNPGEIQRDTWMTEISKMWIVSQYPGEYNPLHVHDNCKISSTMYLKIPKMLPARKKRRPSDDGSIQFVNNSSMDIDLSAPAVTISPQVGDFLIFGALQQHLVYPFRCEEGDPERRSISFNAVFQSKEQFDYNVEMIEPIEDLIKEKKFNEVIKKVNSSSLDETKKRQIFRNVERLRKSI